MCWIKTIMGIGLLALTSQVWAATPLASQAINFDLTITKPTCSISGLKGINMGEVKVGHSSEQLLQLGVDCPYDIQNHLAAFATNISADKKKMYLDANRTVSFSMKDRDTRQDVLFDGSMPMCQGEQGLRQCVYNTMLAVSPSATAGDYSGIVTFKLFYN
ncbi:hypothetical protein ACPV5G_16090 [Photobacterium damselae]|uniref:hypothetical protein n=1 Tax=Photobacterium damselae TaxID=38293 RepID=UPI00406939F2